MRSANHRFSKEGDSDAVVARGLDFGAIEADPGRFDDHVDIIEHAGDTLGAKGAVDAVEPPRRLGIGGVVEQQQGQLRVPRAQEPDRRPAFAPDPPDRDPRRAQLSRTHRAWP